MTDEVTKPMDYDLINDMMQNKTEAQRRIKRLEQQQSIDESDITDTRYSNETVIVQSIEIPNHQTLPGLLDSLSHAQYTPKNGWDTDAKDSVTLSFDDGTRTFTFNASEAVKYYKDGIEYVFSGASTAEITDTEGRWYIYFVGSVLTASQTPWVINDGNALVSVIYWDATNNKHISRPHEMHTNAWSRKAHDWAHDTLGTLWDKNDGGLGLTLNGTITVDISIGKIHDEDIDVTITDGAGGARWEQVLSPAEMPVFYRTTTPVWNKVTATNVPAYLVTNVLKRNNLSGSTWTLADVTLNRYVDYWIIATNDEVEPIILLIGQGNNTTITSLRNTYGIDSLNLADLPYAEYRVLHRIIVKRVAGSPYYEVSYDATQDDFRANSLSGPGGSSTVTYQYAANLFKLFDPTDQSKLVSFLLSGITTATERVLTIQDKDYVVADDADIATDIATHAAIASAVHGLGAITNSPDIDQDLKTTDSPNFTNLGVNGSLDISTEIILRFAGGQGFFESNGHNELMEFNFTLAIFDITSRVQVRNHSDSNSNIFIASTTAVVSYLNHDFRDGIVLSTDDAVKPTTDTWDIASDAGIKTETGKFLLGLAQILELDTITYRFNGEMGFEDNGEHRGLIADKVQTIFPNAVKTMTRKWNHREVGTGEYQELPTMEKDVFVYVEIMEDVYDSAPMKTLNTHDISLAKINAIKELDQKIEDQAQEISFLKTENNKKALLIEDILKRLGDLEGV